LEKAKVPTCSETSAPRVVLNVVQRNAALTRSERRALIDSIVEEARQKNWKPSVRDEEQTRVELERPDHKQATIVIESDGWLRETVVPASRPAESDKAGDEDLARRRAFTRSERAALVTRAIQPYEQSGWAVTYREETMAELHYTQRRCGLCALWDWVLRKTVMTIEIDSRGLLCRRRLFRHAHQSRA